MQFNKNYIDNLDMIIEYKCLLYIQNIAENFKYPPKIILYSFVVTLLL